MREESEETRGIQSHLLGDSASLRVSLLSSLRGFDCDMSSEAGRWYD